MKTKQWGALSACVSFLAAASGLLWALHVKDHDASRPTAPYGSAIPYASPGLFCLASHVGILFMRFSIAWE